MIEIDTRELIAHNVLKSEIDFNTIIPFKILKLVADEVERLDKTIHVTFDMLDLKAFQQAHPNNVKVLTKIVGVMHTKKFHSILLRYKPTEQVASVIDNASKIVWDRLETERHRKQNNENRQNIA